MSIAAQTSGPKLELKVWETLECPPFWQMPLPLLLGRKEKGTREKKRAEGSLYPKLVVFENKTKQKKLWVSSMDIQLELPKLRESWRSAAQGKQANGMQFAHCILSTGSAASCSAASIYHQLSGSPGLLVFAAGN